MDNECDLKKRGPAKKKDAPAVRAHFDEEVYQANRARIAVVMNHFFLRYLNLLYNEFDGDIVLPIVLGEIAHHNITRFLSREKNCMSLIITGYDELSPKFETCNAHSISEATGIPRETVRRKIDKLLKKGWLLKNDHSEVVFSHAVGEHFMQDFNLKLISELLEASDCLRELLKVKADELAATKERRKA